MLLQSTHSIRTVIIYLPKRQQGCRLIRGFHMASQHDVQHTCAECGTPLSCLSHYDLNFPKRQVRWCPNGQCNQFGKEIEDPEEEE